VERVSEIALFNTLLRPPGPRQNNNGNIVNDSYNIPHAAAAARLTVGKLHVLVLKLNARRPS